MACQILMKHIQFWSRLDRASDPLVIFGGRGKKKKKKVPFLTPMEDLIAGKAETPHILCPSIAYTSWIWFWEYLYRQSWKKDGGTKYLVSVTLSDLWPWQNFKPISDQLDRMAELPVKFQESRYSGKGQNLGENNNNNNNNKHGNNNRRPNPWPPNN